MLLAYVQCAVAAILKMETEKRNQSEAPTISFGFKATSDSKKLQTKSIIDESKSEVLETDFVKGFDGEGIQSVIEKPKPSGPLVIPLIRANNWRRKETQSVATGSTSNDEPEKEDLSKAAAKELIDEAKKFDDDQDSDQITHNSTKAIPLLLQNQVSCLPYLVKFTWMSTIINLTDIRLFFLISC